MKPIPAEIEKIVTEIIDAAYTVHSSLGPGLMESAYEACLIYELRKRGFKVESQVLLPIAYDGQIISNSYRIDLLINDCVIVELKVVDQIIPLHVSQLLTYLRFSDHRLGLIINYNTRFFCDSVKRVIR